MQIVQIRFQMLKHIMIFKLYLQRWGGCSKSVTLLEDPKVSAVKVDKNQDQATLKIYNLPL